MNIEHFNKLMNQEGRLAQNPPEWQLFLEFCEMYLTKYRIKEPIVVELGTLYGMQKRFYEELLGARYIGIDSNNERCTPDIVGFTEDPKTLAALKEMLGGRQINILFIDASHRYRYVKKDFEMYAPLCSDIIALHDIEAGRYSPKPKHEVWRLWDELREEAYTGAEEYKNTMFLSMCQCRHKKNRSSRIGIGVMIRG